MNLRESVCSLFKGTTPFCLDLDDDNSYIIDDSENE